MCRGRTSALGHPNQSHALNRAVAPSKEGRIVAPRIGGITKAANVKLGSSASHPCAAARASATDHLVRTTGRGPTPATPLSEVPQSAASRLIARLERSTKKL